MNNFIYSPSLNLFYDSELVQEYKNAGTWPDDGVNVSDADFLKYSGPAPEGMVRICGGENYPAWGEIPPLTHDEEVAQAEDKQQELIASANAYMNSKQWPGKAALGRLKGDELVQYNAWLDYLDALDAIDTSNAPNVDWPQSPEV